MTDPQGHDHPHPRRPWFWVCLIAAVASGMFSAGMLYLPGWRWKIPLVVAALVFGIVWLRNPAYLFARLAASCAGAAVATGLARTVRVFVHIGDGRLAE